MLAGRSIQSSKLSKPLECLSVERLCRLVLIVEPANKNVLAICPKRTKPLFTLLHPRNALVLAATTSCPGIGLILMLIAKTKVLNPVVQRIPVDVVNLHTLRGVEHLPVQ